MAETERTPTEEMTAEELINLAKIGMEVTTYLLDKAIKALREAHKNGE